MIMTTEKRQTAFIAKVLNGLFTVITVEGRELSATAKGNLRYHKSPLCVGDEIDYILTPQAETAAQIVACRQRRNMWGPGTVGNCQG